MDDNLAHHPGMHVDVNLEGKTVGGVVCGPGWVPGVIVGVGAMGLSLSVQLDTPIGGGEPHGLFRRPGRGEDMVSLDPVQVRRKALEDVYPDGIPQEIVDLVRAGKMKQAIGQYRALNGATLDEARAALRALEA